MKKILLPTVLLGSFTVFSCSKEPQTSAAKSKMHTLTLQLDDNKQVVLPIAIEQDFTMRISAEKNLLTLTGASGIIDQTMLSREPANMKTAQEVPERNAQVALQSATNETATLTTPDGKVVHAYFEDRSTAN